MSRVVSLCLPTWPTDRVRRRLGAAAPDAATPLVLIGQAGQRREVVAADGAAFQAGLRIGMPATQAQALVAGLVIHHADPASDTEALERLAVWALRYSPLVAADAPDGIVIDATGAAQPSTPQGSSPWTPARSDRIFAMAVCTGWSWCS